MMGDRDERQRILYDTDLSPETKLYRLIKMEEKEIKERNPELWYAMLEWKDKNIDKIDFGDYLCTGYRNRF